MRRLLSRWLLSFIGTALLAGLLWLFGPLWPPLEPVLPRVVAVQTLLVLWAALNALGDWRRRSRDRALTAGLSAGEESAAVAQAFHTALAATKGHGRLADLPWYAIIGPPGAGKTTALLNAGLRFTAGDGVTPGATKGVGGTRLCDWWFTQDAVLIDTAGRYTTQDSDAAIDRAGWNAFLSLVKRTRPAQPLNGVLVAIGLPDVVQAPQAERDAHASAIRRRIEELEHRFGLRIPVYALFTKADLVAGFTETFDDLDAEARTQVWGETYPLAPDPAARFTPGFQALAARLAARMLPRLAAEHRADRRPAIMGFPTQFASLEKPLSAFVGAAFGGNTMLRGAYFTSGTQEGAPMDRLTGAMARTFGLPAARPAAHAGSGRSYFLGRLLRDVVFNEAALVRRPPHLVRRRLLLRATAFATVLLLASAAAATLLWAAGAATDQVAATARSVADYEQQAAPLATETVADAELRPLAGLLDQAASLAAAVPAAPVAFGLGQAPKLQAAAAAAYRDALVFGLLPRLVWRLETEMRGALADPQRLYDLTRIYLMLGGEGPLDPAPIRAWATTEWRTSLADDAPIADTLLTHLDRLLAEPLPPVALDAPLVTAARASFGAVPPAARVYAALRASAAANALPPWRPFDALGPAGSLVFTRASGKPMTEGIPGLFTAAGYRSVMSRALPAATHQVATETWVLGRRTEPTPPAQQQAEQQQLEQAVTALYAADVTARWDALLADLDIAPIASLPQAAQAFYVLASPESPLRALLRSMATQLQVPGIPPARYAGLTALATGDGAPLERALRLVADVQQPLAKIAALPVGTAAPAGGEDIGAALATEAQRQPQPLGRWLGTVGAIATALRTGNAKRQVALAYNAPGGPAQACAAAVARYPFAPAAAPLPPEDLTRVFGPAGLLDAFLNTQLKPYLDTSVKPWKPQPGAPLAPADALQFQRAAAIRDALFSPGSTPGYTSPSSPSFTIQLTPAPPLRAATLTLGAATLTSGQGPPRATDLTWPPTGAPAEASLTADALSLRETGFWALHRLAARGRLQPGSRPGHLLLQFGNSLIPILTYDVAAPALSPALFTDFRCPALAAPLAAPLPPPLAAP